MYENDLVLLRSVLRQSVLENFREEDTREEADANEKQLVGKIRLLPEDTQNLLCMKYVFHVSPAIAEDLLSYPHAKQRAQYAENLLAYSMGVSESQKISQSCMEKAAKAVLSQWMAEYDTENGLAKPHYSRQFRKALKEIRTAQTYNHPVVLKRAVAIILVAAMIFAATITANAELRARFFRWLIETFPAFSQFSAIDVPQANELSFDTLKNIKIEYIPDGFVLTDVFEADPMIVYSYQDAAGNTLSINADLSTGSPTLFDMEDTEIHQIVLNGQTAYWWEKENTCFLVWQKDGFSLNLVGKISYEEAIKIAEKIYF